MTVTIHLETVLPVPRADAFDLALDLDMHLSSMSASGERIVAGRDGGLIGAGEFVAWRARHLGLPFTLMSRITTFEPAVMFIDEEIAGPFRRLRHVHRFVDHDAGSLMIDDITFEAPLGLLGRLVERFVLERYLRDLIETRNRHLLATVRGSGTNVTDPR